jgi:hypothetical protein
MVPFVWRDYDKNNTYNIDPWQRVENFDEFKERVLALKEDCGKLIKQYRDNYKKVLLSEDEYYEQFSDMMNGMCE